MHKTREKHIYVVHPIWATSTKKWPILPFILSSKMKRYNLQQMRCNSLFSLTQSPLYFSHRIQIYISAIQFPHIQRGVSFYGKNLKLNITSTVRSLPNEWPRLTMKLQHFTRKFYIYFQIRGCYPQSPAMGGSK